MKKTIILSLKKEIFKEAEEIKKEIEQDPTLDKIEVTEEMDRSLLEKIQAYEKEEKNLAQIKEEMAHKFEKKEKNIESSNEIGITKEDVDAVKQNRTVVYPKRRLSVRVFVAVAAIAIMVMAFGMTGVCGKLYRLVMKEEQLEDGTLKIIDEADMNSIPSDSLIEDDVLVRAGEALGVKIPKLLYKPEGMYLESYIIEEDMQQAYIFYMYGEEKVRYWIKATGVDASTGIVQEDEKIKEDTITVDGVNILIKEFDIGESDYNRFVAEFIYEEGYYELEGCMEEEKFVKIVENLFF